MHGGFVEEDGEHWYRIDGIDGQAPFFTTLAQVWRCWLKKLLNSWGVMV